MRVITGSAKGISLVAPKGLEIARPTTDRVKEGVFSAVQFDIVKARVLDLFAGSGQLGIEALSRGAKSCTFVESNKESVACIKTNLKNTQLKDFAKVVTLDALEFVRHTDQIFDIVFLDPPYKDDIVLKVLNELQRCVVPNGRVFCESTRERTFENVNLTEKKQYRYGSIKVTQFVVPEVER